MSVSAAALQVGAPRVVGEVAAVEPVLPVVGGPDEALVGLLEVLGRRVLAPRERGVHGLARLDQVAAGDARALDAEVHVRRDAQLEVRAGRARDRRPVGVAVVLPRHAARAVVEDGLAGEAELDLAVDAAHRAHEDVVGVVVGRRAAVRARAVGLVVPRPDEQRVADDDPAALGAPARLEDHRARQVATAGRHLDAGRAEPEPAGVAVEQRAEDARGVHARKAEPLDAAVGRDQRRGLAVRQEPVVGDRREGTSGQPGRRRAVNHSPAKVSMVQASAYRGMAPRARARRPARGLRGCVRPGGGELAQDARGLLDGRQRADSSATPAARAA